MIELIDTLLQGIEKQEREDGEILHLTAYDNCLSKTAQKLLSSELSQRYHLGTLDTRKGEDPASMGEFLFKGLLHVENFERHASQAANEMFFAEKCDFRPLSGMHAMISSLLSLTKPGDVIYSIDCNYGGHFATQSVLRLIHRISAFMPVDEKTFNIDLEKFSMQVKKHPPQAIYFDVGCALFPIPLREIRNIVGPEVKIIYDASHSLGLIAGGQFQSPLQEGSDVLQGNTHKTFPGPQKGMLCFKNETLANKTMDQITEGLLSSQHTHHSLALYLTLLEMKQFGAAYAKQMVSNAKALAHALAEVGIEILAAEYDYTDTNTLLISGRSVGGHVAACRKLYECNIATNSRSAYGQQVIRIGVQEVTRKGMKEDNMKEIACFFKKALKDQIESEYIQGEVVSYMQNFTQIHYSFDLCLSELPL